MPQPAINPLQLRSDVCRDLIQSAEIFKHPKNVVWEYVTNGLDYHENGTKPVVNVRIGKNEIEISDNGRGMNRDDLQRFFTMHAENLDRKTGRNVRGMFGTGKSAAFAIANTLRIETIRNGHKNVVQLQKDKVKALVGQYKDIPIEEIVTNEVTKAANGTRIIITDFMKDFKKITAKPIVEYIEQNLAGMPQHWTVFVDGTKCEYNEPTYVACHEFYPTEDTAKIIGNVKLEIKVSGTPLERNLRGVKVISSNQVHETVNEEGKECAEYIFGTVIVPKLDQEENPPAFDSSRSGQLNYSNHLVIRLLGFINSQIDEVRKELVLKKKAEKKSEEAKKFKRIENEVSNIINEHFNEFRTEINTIQKAAGSGGKDLIPDDSSDTEGDDDGLLVAGDDIPAAETETPFLTGHGEAEQPKGEGSPPEAKPEIVKDEEEPTTKATSGGGSEKARPRGGFNVKADHIGSEERRTKYVPSERTIVVNLDHPQIKAAYQENVDDPIFKRLFYEVAFLEYVNALMYERVAANEYFPDFYYFLDEFQRRVNDIATRSAALYAA